MAFLAKRQSTCLIHVQFDLRDWHRLLDFRIAPGSSVHCLWDKLQYQIEILLVFLHTTVSISNPCTLATTDLVAVGFEERFQVYDIWVAYQTHNLQLSVLNSDQHRLSSGVLAPTLNFLSCSTFLMAISCSSSSGPPSFGLAESHQSAQGHGDHPDDHVPSIFAANTTPKLPFPTTLQLVYEMVTSWPVLPDCALTVTTLFGSSATHPDRSVPHPRSHPRSQLGELTGDPDAVDQSCT